MIAKINRLLKSITAALKRRWNTYVASIFVKISYKFTYKWIANNNKNILIKMADIKGMHSVSVKNQNTFVGIIKDGDWDKTHESLESLINTSAKLNVFKERFVEGKPWRETNLFKGKYTDFLNQGKKIIDLFDNLY